MDQITSFLSYVGVIAVGAERFTDVIKRIYLEKKEVPGYVYQLTTFACGFALCFIQPPEFKIFGFDQLIKRIYYHQDQNSFLICH